MAKPAANPIVVTGCGWITPVAAGGIAQVLTGDAGARGALPGAALPDGYWPVPDDRAGDYPDLSTELKRDKAAWLAGAAMHHARKQAIIDDKTAPPDRIGLALGCALAGQLGMIQFADEVRAQSARFVSPIHFPQTVGNYVAGALSRGFALCGPNLTLAAGEASSLDAIVEACAWLTSGAADVVFAGGVEQLSPHLAKGLAEPGVVFSEGACLLVLERLDHATSRGATVLATITNCVRPASAPGPAPINNDAIVATTSPPVAGAIFAEAWTGRCLGAAGAAATATAIGAATGLEVPRTGTDPDPDPRGAANVNSASATNATTAPTRYPLDKLRHKDGSIPIKVYAQADDAHWTMLELNVRA